MEMLKAGFATVYEAKSGAEFGDFEDEYRKLEKRAKAKKQGLWAAKHLESPREYKTRMANLSNEQGNEQRKELKQEKIGGFWGRPFRSK